MEPRHRQVVTTVHCRRHLSLHTLHILPHIEVAILFVGLLPIILVRVIRVAEVLFINDPPNVYLEVINPVYPIVQLQQVQVPECRRGGTAVVVIIHHLRLAQYRGVV